MTILKVVAALVVVEPSEQVTVKSWVVNEYVPTTSGNPELLKLPLKVVVAVPPSPDDPHPDRIQASKIARTPLMFGNATPPPQQLQVQIASAK